MEIPVVFRNSRFLIGVVYFGSLSGMVLAVCFLLITFAQFSPTHAGDPGKIKNVLEWAISSICSAFTSAWLFKLGGKMAHYEARLDDNGVDFRLGTKAAPQNLFMPWNGIGSIQYKRVGNTQWVGVRSKNNDFAQFNSYTFFRPKKLAKLIAARSGQQIQKA